MQLLRCKAVDGGRSSKHSMRVEHLRMTVWQDRTEMERKRERERGTKEVLLIQRVKQYNQPHKEVTRSLYIVTNLGQLPFELITQMAQTLAIQRDSVNTSIIHLYSTHSYTFQYLIMNSFQSYYLRCKDCIYVLTYSFFE